MERIRDKEILNVIKIKRYLRVQIMECKEEKEKINNGIKKGDLKELALRIEIYKELLEKFDQTDKLNTTLKSSLQITPTSLFNK